MLIAIDIGNTSTSIGLFRGERLAKEFRVPTVELKSERGWRRRVVAPLQKINRKSWDGLIVTSVVPAANLYLTRAARDRLQLKPMWVSAALKLPIKIHTKNPKKIGADRLVNAVAAFKKFGGPCIIVDLGTATTVDLVDRRGNFLGGAIAPGLAIAAEALSQRGAQLPKLRLKKPTRAVGRTTQEAMRSGVVGGYVGLIDGLVRQIIQETGSISRKKIIATGGLAPKIFRMSRTLGRLVPHLTLEGLQIIWAINQDK